VTPPRVMTVRATIPRTRLSVSGRIPVRYAAVSSALVVLVVVIGLIALGIGTYHLDALTVLRALVGLEDPQTQMLVVQWRLPRVLFAVACGIALGVSGAVFQSLTRNPLGSPDILGFASGSYTGAVIVMLWMGSTAYLDIGVGSLVGGLLTAATVYVLARRNGTVQPFRLIVMGIGIAAMLSSVNSALMMFVDVDTAMLAAVWASGSLNGLGNEQLWPMIAVLVVMMTVVARIASAVNQMEIGDDAARALGIRVETVRGVAIVVGVGLTALVTAAAGPIAFVALAAPQIAKRLTRGSGLQVIPSALVGALVLLVSDIIAQRAGFPVGVVTVSLGGAYLTWLLAMQYRRTR
jgi:iron complex transport system permease protein